MSKPATSSKEYLAILRSDFYAFVVRCFIQLNPDLKLLRNWHLEVMTATLEAWRLGQVRRLIVNLPPRHLKSLCASVALPAWILGHNPAAQIICVSYSADLAEKLARDCRSIMMTPWYRQLFPSTRISSQKSSVQEFVTTAGGFRLSTSVGGVLTGRGADYIIIDDPLKPVEALSDALGAQRMRGSMARYTPASMTNAPGAS
jgi:hypothetical protein